MDGWIFIMQHDNLVVSMFNLSLRSAWIKSYFSHLVR